MPESTVIAEIGGSSSRWAWCSGSDTAIRFPLRGDAVLGFNPLNGDADAFVQDVRSYLDANGPEALSAERVITYAAGCGSPDRARTMEEALKRLWPDASLSVGTDIMGAALGLCGKEKVLVLILGTGMNAGHFNGVTLHQPMPSLGWILGDEGSGADIGRCLLQDAFYRRIPEDVKQMIFGVDGPRSEIVLEQVHRSPFPSKALAAYTSLIVEFREQPYVRDLIMSRFHALADLLITFFSAEMRSEVYATGSVAYGFRELLSECLLDRGMTLTVVEPDPLPGLVRYHCH